MTAAEGNARRSERVAVKQSHDRVLGRVDAWKAVAATLELRRHLSGLSKSHKCSTLASPGHVAWW